MVYSAMKYPTTEGMNYWYTQKHGWISKIAWIKRSHTQDTYHMIPFIWSSTVGKKLSAVKSDHWMSGVGQRERPLQWAEEIWGGCDTFFILTAERWLHRRRYLSKLTEYTFKMGSSCLNFLQMRITSVI